MACFCYANIFSAALPLQVISAPLEGSCKSCFDINMDMMTLYFAADLLEFKLISGIRTHRILL